MKYTGKEADLTFARLERFLSIPVLPGLGMLFFGVGAAGVFLGFGLWLVTSDWWSLLGGNMIFLGVIIAFMGAEWKNHPSRLTLSPLVGLLGWFAIRRIVSMSLILEYRQGIDILWRNSHFDFIDCSARAELIGALGVFGFWCGWKLSRHGRGVRCLPEPLMPPGDHSLWGAYVISLLLYVTNMVFPHIVGRLGSFGGRLVEMSSGVAFAVAVFWGATRPILSLLASVVLLVPFSTRVMTFGMKSAFLQPFMPAFHALMLRSLRWPFLISVFVLPFLLLFVFPYVKAFRNEAWFARRDVKEGELAQEVWHDVQQTGYRESSWQSWKSFQARYSSIGVTGAIVDLVDTEGILGPIFLKNLHYALIPRLLWPGKPAFEPAAWLSDKLFGITTSATAFHLPLEWYWMFGWPGSFLGLALMGYAYAWVHRVFLLNSLRGPTFFAGWFLLFSFVSGVEEVRANATFQQPLILLGVIWTMHALSRFVALRIRDRPGDQYAPGT